MHIQFSFLASFLVLLSGFSIAATPVEITERGVTVSIPENWTVENFDSGDAVLRISANDAHAPASCTITVFPMTFLPAVPQSTVDKLINSVAPSDTHQKQFADNVAKKCECKVEMGETGIKTISGRPFRFFAYTTSAPSQKTDSPGYTSAFYMGYLQQKDMLGLTCTGSGQSKDNARASFEKHDAGFQKISSSMRLAQ